MVWKPFPLLFVARTSFLQECDADPLRSCLSALCCEPDSERTPAGLRTGLLFSVPSAERMGRKMNSFERHPNVTCMFGWAFDLSMKALQGGAAKVDTRGKGCCSWNDSADPLQLHVRASRGALCAKLCDYRLEPPSCIFFTSLPPSSPLVLSDRDLPLFFSRVLSLLSPISGLSEGDLLNRGHSIHPS